MRGTKKIQKEEQRIGRVNALPPNTSLMYFQNLQFLHCSAINVCMYACSNKNIFKFSEIDGKNAGNRKKLNVYIHIARCMQKIP